MSRVIVIQQRQVKENKMKPLLTLMLLFLILIGIVFLPDSQNYLLFVYDGAEIQLSFSYALCAVLVLGLGLVSVSYIMGRFRQWLRGVGLFSMRKSPAELIFPGDEWKYLKSTDADSLVSVSRNKDQSAGITCIKGRNLWRQKQYAQALTFLEKAVEFDPKQPIFYIPLIECLLTKGDGERALKWARKLKRLPNITQEYVLQAKARAYAVLASQTDHVKKKQDFLERGNYRDPQNLKIIVDLYNCYKQQGKDKAGTMLIEGAWKYHQTKELLLLYVKGAKDSWDILSRVQRLVSFAPHSAYGVYLNCWAHLNIGNVDQAKALMTGDVFAKLSSQQQAHLALVTEIVEGGISREKLRSLSVLSLFT